MSDQELRERRSDARQDKTPEGFEPSPAAWMKELQERRQRNDNYRNTN